MSDEKSPPPLGSEPPRQMPHNIEAEQALLGAILVSNEAYHRIHDFLEADHFFEALHQRIFEVAASLIDAKKLASPVTMKNFLPADTRVGDMNLKQYLVRLASEAVTVVNAYEYGRAVHDLWIRRSLILAGEDMVSIAYDAPVDVRPGEIGEKAIANINRAISEDADDGFEPIGETVGRITDTFSSGESRPTIPLPFDELRTVMGGDLEVGNLYGMLSSSGEGKTSLALQIFHFVASQGHPAIFLTYDQSPAQCIDQIASQITGIENTRLRKRDGLLEKELDAYYDALKAIRSLPIVIRKCSGSVDGAMQLVRYATNFHNRFCRRPRRIGMVFVDHARKVKPYDERAHEGRIAAYNNGVFKQRASDTGMVWLNLMQRSSTGSKRKNPRPIDTDIFGGEMGREDYDGIFYLYRAQKYINQQLQTADDEKEADRIRARFARENWEPDEAEVGALKARFADPTRTFRLRFIKESTSYVSKRETGQSDMGFFG